MIANCYGSGYRQRPYGTPRACTPCPCAGFLVRDPEGEFKTPANLCTELEADPQKIDC